MRSARKVVGSVWNNTGREALQERQRALRQYAASPPTYVRDRGNDGLSLDEIAKRLGTMDEGGVRDEALRHGSALDYVRSVLGGHTVTLAESTALYDASLSMAAPPPAPPPRIEATRWERIEVVPGIELHVRHPVSPERRRLITAYISRARNELEGNA